jgi:hypothetical protein
MYRLLSTVACVFGCPLCLGGFAVGSRGQTMTPAAQLESLRKATSLDREGMPAWHLRVSFQLYSLEGKPSETGTLEEWWTSPTVHRTVVTAPSIAHWPGGTDRDSVLVATLLRLITHPVGDLSRFPGRQVSVGDRTFGQVALTCFNSAYAMPKGSNAPANDSDSFCVLPQTYDLRLVLRANYGVVARSHPGEFFNTRLGLDTMLRYNGLAAISGHVETLETLDPVKFPASVELDPLSDEQLGGRLTGGVLERESTMGGERGFPIDTSPKRPGGAVMLHLILSKQGKAKSVVVIASSDQTSSDAIVRSIAELRWTPCRLDGQPVERELTFILFPGAV